MERIGKILALAALGAGWLSGTASADTMTLRADAWCPYNCPPASGDPGYIVEIAQAVLEAAGHRVDYRLMPWTEALEAVRAGRITGAPGATVGEVGDLVHPSAPMGYSVTALAVRKGVAFTYEGVASLAKLRLGVVDGYAYDDGPVDRFLAENRQSGTLLFAKGDNAGEELMYKLAEGELDAMIEDANVLDYALAVKGLDGLFDIIPVSDPVPLTIALSPKDPNAATYAALLDQGIQAMRQDGRLAAILNRYGLKDWDGQAGASKP